MAASEGDDLINGTTDQGERRSGRATLHDVARACGFSTATVARVLDGSGLVRPDTRDRVLEAVQQLNFQRNALARDLKRGTSQLAVGLVVGGFANRFFMRVALGAEHELRKAGIFLVLATTDYDIQREESVIRTLFERRVSALLIATGGDSHKYLAAERDIGTPIVFVNRAPVDLDADCVMFDERGAVRDATLSLLEAGHTRIAVLAGSRLTPTFTRLAGFHDALEVRGLTIDQALVRRNIGGAAEARSVTRDLLSRPGGPSAILALNQEITISVATELLYEKCPPAFVGFDDFDMSDALGTTVIVRDAEELGRRAARMAMSRIHQRATSSEQIVLSPTIIHRSRQDSASASHLGSHTSPKK